MTFVIRYWDEIRRFSLNARLYLLSVVCSALATSLFLLFFNLYVISAGYSRSFLGQLTALPPAVGLLAGLPLSLWAQRLSHKQALLLGGLFEAGAIGLFLFAGGEFAWNLAAVLLGIGQVLIVLTQAPFLTAQSTPVERTALFSVLMAAFNLASFAGNVAGGQLPAWLAGRLAVEPESADAYRATLTVAAGLAALSLIPILLLRDRRSRPEAPGSPRSLSGVRHAWPRLARLGLPNLLIGLGAALLIPYMNVFFKTRFGVDDGALGLLFGLLAVSTGLATLAAPVLAGRFGKIRAVVVTELVSLVFLGLLGLGSFAVAAVAFLVRGALMNMGVPLYTAFAMEQTPERQRSLTAAAMNGAYGAGWAVGPWISGLVQERYGFGPLFVSTILLYALAATVMYVFFKDAERPSPAQAPAGGATFAP